MTGLQRAPTRAAMYSAARTMSAAAPQDPFASERPAIAVQGSDSNECGNLLPTQGPQFGEIHNQRPGEPWPYPWHRAEQIVFLSPDGTLVNGVRERSFGLRHLTFEPCDVRVQALMHEVGRASETVFLRRQHLDELATSGKECGERLHLFIRQRPGYGTDDVGEMGENLRVEGIGLGQLPRRLGKVPHLSRIGDHDRQPRRDERPAEWQLETTGRFQDDQRNRESPQTLDHVGKPGLIIGYDETSFGSQGNIQLSLRDIDTNKPWGRCHGLLPWWPILA